MPIREKTCQAALRFLIAAQRFLAAAAIAARPSGLNRRLARFLVARAG
jgi:hypothetical protein